MAPAIFFSWQTDVPSNLNKAFILEALTEAANGIAIDSAERLDVDEGMKDTPGSPEVANVLFSKIDEAFLFVGDVTLVGQIPHRGKLLQEGQVVNDADMRAARARTSSRAAAGRDRLSLTNRRQAGEHVA